MQCCRISEDQTPCPPSLCLSSLFSLQHGFTVKIGYMPWESGEKLLFCPRQCPYFLNKVVGESRTCGDTLEKVKWWFCINRMSGIHVEKNYKYILWTSSPGMNFPCLLNSNEMATVQLTASCPLMKCRWIRSSDVLGLWKRRQSVLIFFPAFSAVFVPKAVVVESGDWNCTRVSESVALQLGCLFCRELWLATRANWVNCLWQLFPRNPYSLGRSCGLGC